MSEGKAASTDRSILGKSGLNIGKLDPQGLATQSPKQSTEYMDVRSNGPLACPECGSQKLWKDGLRYGHGSLREETTQRWLCRNCGYRFTNTRNAKVGKTCKISEPSECSEGVQNVDRQILNCRSALPSSRQVCELLTEDSKNLATVETQPTKEKAAGATTPELATIKGLIIQYMAWLEKEGYYKDSVYPKLIKRLIKRGANLMDPENVKETIAKTTWKDSVKMLAIFAYDIMATKILKITWMPPKYKQKETLPFVPDEQELDQLIAGCRSHRMATFLQTLKETFADPGEILGLQWKDLSGNILSINNPVKGHSAGQVQISNRLAAMLNNLPKTSTRIFPTTYASIYTTFWKMKKRVAHQLQNPRLRQIELRSFRHWGGSMIAHYTNGNVLTVQKMLRHKCILSSMKYIHMIHLKDDEFEVTSATDVEEAKKVLEAGFEYVTQKDGIMLFKKPKRFKG